MDITPLCTWTQACALAVMVVGMGQQLEGQLGTACMSAARWPIRKTLRACTVTAPYPAVSPFASLRSLRCRQLVLILSDVSLAQKSPLEALAPLVVPLSQIALCSMKL